jgi:hypothetical protein
MRQLSVLMILLVTFSVNGQYLNPIVEELKEGVYNGSAVLTDTHLIYQAQKDGNRSLWSMDLNTKIKEEILVGTARSIITLNNLVYFSVQSEDSNYHLWSTDGTAENTKKTNDTVIDGLIYINGGHLFAQNQQMQLLQLRDQQLINLELRLSSPNNLCAFENNDLIVLPESSEPNTYALIRISGDTISEIYNFTSESSIQPQFTYFNDTCYFSYKDQDGLKTVILPETGEVTLYSPPSDIPAISHFFSHQNRLYVVAGNGYIFNSIYRLTPDLTGHDATITINDFYDFSSTRTVNQLIATVVSGREFESPSTELMLDRDLNVIDTFYTYSVIRSSTATATMSEIILGTTSTNGSIIQRINADNQVLITSINDHQFLGLISNSNSADFYLKLHDDNTGKSNIYSYNDQPRLNDLINGIWHEPDIINQGLVIQKGRRQNGSEYVFTTFYTFDQGEPLWLAGVSDLLPEQQQLEITLYQYDGPQLFQYDVTPDRTVFGRLTLEMETCDQLKATISSDDYNQSINLYRIDDTTYKHLCVDIQPLTLDGTNKVNNLLENGHE